MNNVKFFNHIPVDIPLLTREDTENGRLYKTSDGNLYPSVTTVLSAMTDKSHLDAWRQRIGVEEADRISKFASARGTAVHSLCEDYVLGRKVNGMPSNMATFNQIKKVLDKHVDNIKACESTLVSHKLKVAGTTDLIAEYDGRLSIIDYKTSAKLKRKQWIEGYFPQSSLYSFMLWEMTGIMTDQIAIIIAVDDNPEAQVFIESPRNYIEKASQMVKDFHNK